MKGNYLLLIVLVVCNWACESGPVSALKKWSEQAPERRQALCQQSFAGQPLTKKEAAEAAGLLEADWKKGFKKELQQSWQQKKYERDGLQMKFDYRLLGEKPKDGRSLYISMHGGGNAPSAVNDQQWSNQIRLYQPEEGLYVAPRAPWDDWNMWFKPGLDEFFEQLIATAVVMEDVNPDKVYLMGYSAGGDGVWRMAPRMADRWAAASMMAGHPGEASQLNLRNVPFMIWMGENDAAYDRNRLAAVHGRLMDTLQMADPQGYVHETHIVAGKGHWMDREDAAALPWMAKFRRNPYPSKVVWRQEDVVRPSLYWLSVRVETARSGMTVIAEYQGNTVNVLHSDYPELTIGLNDQMMDLDLPVRVVYQGKVLFEGKVNRTIRTLEQNLKERRDPRYLFSGEVTVKL